MSPPSVPTRSTGRVSSPTATGASGSFFEQHVDAYWLALLLVRGIPAVLRDCTVVEVCFQTEWLGWNTDDFLVVGETSAGTHRKLVGQVKRTFTISASNDGCKKAMQDFWKDFNDSARFSPVTDCFALVTLRGTNTLLEHFSGLLDCARAARDGREFESRLATPGFLSAKSVRYCDEIRTIIGEIEGNDVSAADIWPFLRVLHVLPLDLNTATAQTESMIKTLLAHTATGPDPSDAAEVSWNALLQIAGGGMPEACTFAWNDLPEALRSRHSQLGGAEQRVLLALSQHTTFVLDGIRTTIGNELHLTRAGVVQQVLAQLEATQIVIVSGPAGIGKSGIAKDACDILAADHFVFSFRAEEFAQPHLDEMLQACQIPANATALGAILAGQARKVLLVESVERLLEKSARDAFADLLNLAATDTSWRILLTCRDYSTDLVRACFLETAKVGHSVVVVPPLDDNDLEAVQTADPTLGRPVGNPMLRQLLRNPYVLDKALQIPWSEQRSLPENEREFRTLFWRAIVRVDHCPAGGMPRRREDAFVAIALRRARALSMHVPCSDLDADAVGKLCQDSLVVCSDQSDALVAPAHDVLEDWAILRWIDEQYVMSEGSVQELSAAIGMHPAVRRTYRKWASELVERQPEAADSLFRAVARGQGWSAQFRDDTLVSLLRSSASDRLLERHSGDLLANDKHLLQRVIHLLRVACVTPPEWLQTTSAQPSLFKVPDGAAWACVLRLVCRNLQLFAQTDGFLLLGFIEDWARGVTWQTPYPEGAESVARIAHWLLPYFDDYRSDDPRKRTLQVIAKIPNAAPDAFAGLLGGGRGDGERNRAARDFLPVIFQGFDGMPAARDMPDIVVSVAREYLLCTEAELRRGWRVGCSPELEPLFGIRSGRSHDFFPASAYRGPFLSLLRHHPVQGIAFITSVFNHSVDWYAHPRVHREYVEPPFEITLTFPDGTSQTQWCNDRLWNLYRGTSVGPDVLQCLLMSLERWLLGFAEVRPRELDAVLVQILRCSDCAALTAVVASIATAFPHASGETLLVLLGCPECILLDRQRLVAESQAPSRLSGLLLGLDARNKVYDGERKEADALPHRRDDLEAAIRNLQLGTLAIRVHEVLDRHRAAMPAVEEQTDRHRIWRLALHRMDLRQYTISEYAGEHAPEDAVAWEDQMTPDSNRHYIRFELKEPEPDINKMAEETAAAMKAMNADAGLLAWGMKVFTREEQTMYDPGQWRHRLLQARDARVHAPRDEDRALGRGGPGFVAAVCVRDHWEEMSPDERDWCADVLCSAVEREADSWNQVARCQLYSMSADRPSAWALPILLGKSLTNATRERVQKVMVVGLTHAIDEVRWNAASGIGKHLWVIDRALTLRCVNALAMQAAWVQQAVEDEENRLRHEKSFSVLHGGEWIDCVEARVAAIVQEQFFEEDGIPADALQMFDSTGWFGTEANSHVLAILGQAPDEPVAIAAFGRLAHTLIACWDEDDDRRRDGRGERAERNRKIDPTLTDLLENFLLQTSEVAATTILEPILDAIGRHPQQVHWILLGLIGMEDRQPNTQQFWRIWELFADRVRCAEWLAAIDREHPIGEEMISAVFLGPWWKDEIRHWRSLDGYAWHIDSLFNDLPPSSTVLDHYVRFLYHIGERSLPASFVLIAKRLEAGEPIEMLKKGDTVFLLEMLLQRHVYSKPLELKRQPEIRTAVLQLLDRLVENGSSAAYRMRDDFVTPLQT